MSKLGLFLNSLFYSNNLASFPEKNINPLLYKQLYVAGIKGLGGIGKYEFPRGLGMALKGKQNQMARRGKPSRKLFRITAFV